jgi:hypothetical protein
MPDRQRPSQAALGSHDLDQRASMWRMLIRIIKFWWVSSDGCEARDNQL